MSATVRNEVPKQAWRTGATSSEAPQFLGNRVQYVASWIIVWYFRINSRVYVQVQVVNSVSHVI